MVNNPGGRNGIRRLKAKENELLDIQYFYTQINNRSSTINIKNLFFENVGNRRPINFNTYTIPVNIFDNLKKSYDIIYENIVKIDNINSLNSCITSVELINDHYNIYVNNVVNNYIFLRQWGAPHLENNFKDMTTNLIKLPRMYFKKLLRHVEEKINIEGDFPLKQTLQPTIEKIDKLHDKLEQVNKIPIPGRLDDRNYNTFYKADDIGKKILIKILKEIINKALGKIQREITNNFSTSNITTNDSIIKDIEKVNTKFNLGINLTNRNISIPKYIESINKLENMIKILKINFTSKYYKNSKIKNKERIQEILFSEFMKLKVNIKKEKSIKKQTVLREQYKAHFDELVGLTMFSDLAKTIDKDIKNFEKNEKQNKQTFNNEDKLFNVLKEKLNFYGKLSNNDIKQLSNRPNLQEKLKLESDKIKINRPFTNYDKIKKIQIEYFKKTGRVYSDTYIMKRFGIDRQRLKNMKNSPNNKYNLKSELNEIAKTYVRDIIETQRQFFKDSLKMVASGKNVNFFNMTKSLRNIDKGFGPGFIKKYKPLALKATSKMRVATIKKLQKIKKSLILRKRKSRKK